MSMVGMELVLVLPTLVLVLPRRRRFGLRSDGRIWLSVVIAHLVLLQQCQTMEHTACASVSVRILPSILFMCSRNDHTIIIHNTHPYIHTTTHKHSNTHRHTHTHTHTHTVTHTRTQTHTVTRTQERRRDAYTHNKQKNTKKNI